MSRLSTRSAGVGCAGSRAVTSTRGIYGLHLGLGLLGAGTSALGLAIVLDALSLQVPSGESLARACRILVLPRPSVGSVLLLAMAGIGSTVLLLAVRSAVRQVVATRRLLAALEPVWPARCRPPGAIVFSGATPRAFCAGLLRPRIYLSSAALVVLRRQELDAILAHEEHHVRRQDPFRLFVARIFADALFFLPILRRLAERYAALAEIAADDAAVRRSGDPATLASALLAFEGHPGPGAVGIAPERVDHLLGDRIGWRFPVTLLSLAILTVAGLLVLAFGAATAGPISLPLVTAQACMSFMIIFPVLVCALLLRSRRMFRVARR